MRRWALRFTVLLAGLALLLAALIAWQWRADLPLETLKERWAGAASRFVDVDGMNVHYRDEGTGPPIVLLHGTGASLHTWDAWATALATDGRRVVRLDLPAFGLTGPQPSGDYRIEAYVDFLDHFAAKLGLDRFTLAGSSLGGLIAWRYALAHAQKVNALILIDAAGYPRTEPPPLVFRLSHVPLIEPLLAHLDPRWLVARTLKQSYGDPSRATPALIDRYTELTLRPGNRAAFGARTKIPLEDRTAELRTLHLPVLVLWGELDHLIPVADAHRFAKDIPGAELHIYPGLGHVGMEEDGPRTVADLRSFLAAHSL